MPGSVGVEWSATKTSGAVGRLVVDYNVAARPVLRARNQMTISDRGNLVPANGLGFAGAIVSTGTMTTDLGADAIVGTVTSIANVFGRERIRIGGDVCTAGKFDHQNAWMIQGALAEHARCFAAHRN